MRSQKGFGAEVRGHRAVIARAKAGWLR